MHRLATNHPVRKDARGAHSNPFGAPVSPWPCAALACCTFLVAALFAAAARADDVTSSLGSEPVTVADPQRVPAARGGVPRLAYNDAVAQREQLEAQAAECQARIDELAAQLPAAQDRAAEAIRSQYKYQQGTNELIELLFSSDGFEQFVATLQYFENIDRHNANQIDELLALQAQMAQEQADLDTALAQAQEQEAAAEAAALAEAKAARAEAQRKAEEEARRRAAEEAERRRAAAAACPGGQPRGPPGRDGPRPRSGRIGEPRRRRHSGSSRPATGRTAATRSPSPRPSTG